MNQPADAIEDIPHPGDEEPITRGEWRRGINLIVARLERLEHLCFHGEVDEQTGVMIRPSLEQLMQRIDAHITVMCGWARMIKWAGAGLIFASAVTLALVQLKGAL